jgi:hypothetical protein
MDWLFLLADAEMKIGFEQPTPAIALVYAQAAGVRCYEPAGSTASERADALERVIMRTLKLSNRSPIW